MRSIGGFLALSILVAGVAWSEEPSSDARTTAKRAYEEGMKLYNLGSYSQAREEFRKGYMAKPDPVFLYNIGQAARLQGDPQDAITSYRAYLRAVPNTPNREEVQAFIDQAVAELARKASPTPPTGIVPPGQNPPPPTTNRPELTTDDTPKKSKTPAIVGGVVAGLVVVVAAVGIGAGIAATSGGSPPLPSSPGLGVGMVTF